MNATSASFHSIDALGKGWAKTKANFAPLLVLGVVGACLELLHRSLSSPGHEGLGNLLALVVQVMQALLTMVYIRSALTLESGRPLALIPRAELFTNFFGYLLTSMAYGLIVAAGLVLFIVPGVVWALKLSFATFLAIDSKLDPIAALRESARLTRGVKWQLLRFGLWMAAVNALGALALGIGLFATIPTTLIAAAHVLRCLQQGSQLPDQQISDVALPPSANTSARVPAA